MRIGRNMSLLAVGSLGTALIGVAPVGAQSLSQGLSQGQQPSGQQIEAFCANWGQLSGSEKKQYRDQYERYCARDEPVFSQPVEPEEAEQQPQQQQQPSPEPDKPDEPEPDLEPVIPEPVIPEPEPLRVDLVGRLELVGELARRPGERQRLRVTVANRGPGGGPHAPAVNRLWARVFLSDRLPAVQGGRGVSLPAVQRGRPVRIAGVPSPGRSREQTAEVVLPATLEDGNYWWCVQVDSRQAIEETNEANNTACARKVVALGGEPDSELSGVFGSKVEGIKDRAEAEVDSHRSRGIELEPVPGNVEPADDDESLPAPLARDLEITSVSALGPPQLGDEHSHFGLGDAVLPRLLYAVLGWPYIYELTVRNNGREQARFRPYYTFGDDSSAKPGTLGLGSIGSDGEGSVAIAGGETKSVRMFVDFRPEALDVGQIVRLDPGAKGHGLFEIRLFLGAVDAPGDSFEERVYKDAVIDNHVRQDTVTLVSSRLYRVVFRPGKLNVVLHDTDRFAGLQSLKLKFGDLILERNLKESCGPRRRGNARVVVGPERGWGEEDDLLVTHANWIDVDFDRPCGLPEGGRATEPVLVAWAPLGSQVPLEIWTVESVEGLPGRVVKSRNVSAFKVRMDPVSFENCMELTTSSEDYYTPRSINKRLSASSINLLNKRGKICVDSPSVPVRKASIEPLKNPFEVEGG